MVIFSASGLVMVVVSFFTKKVPLDELGGLTWLTINDPPISHGAIGEEAECERVENGGARVAGNSDGIELIKKGETCAIVMVIVSFGCAKYGYAFYRPVFVRPKHRKYFNCLVTAQKLELRISLVGN